MSIITRGLGGPSSIILRGLGRAIQIAEGTKPDSFMRQYAIFKTEVTQRCQ